MPKRPKRLALNVRQVRMLPNTHPSAIPTASAMLSHGLHSVQHPASSSHPEPQHHKRQTRSWSQSQDKTPSCKKLVQELPLLVDHCAPAPALLSTSGAWPVFPQGPTPWLAAPLLPCRQAATPAQVWEPEGLPPGQFCLQDRQRCRKCGGTLHLLQ